MCNNLGEALLCIPDNNLNPNFWIRTLISIRTKPISTLRVRAFILTSIITQTVFKIQTWTISRFKLLNSIWVISRCHAQCPNNSNSFTPHKATAMGCSEEVSLLIQGMIYKWQWTTHPFRVQLERQLMTPLFRALLVAHSEFRASPGCLQTPPSTLTHFLLILKMPCSRQMKWINSILPALAISYLKIIFWICKSNPLISQETDQESSIHKISCSYRISTKLVSTIATVAHLNWCKAICLA